LAQQPTAVRKVSFLRQGDQVVWITTENGKTTVRAETSPLQAPQHRSSDFLAYTRELMDDPAHEMRLAIPRRKPLALQQAPVVEATPLPPRTTVVTHEALRPGKVQEIVQSGPPFGFEELVALLLVAAFVIGGLTAFLRRTTRPA